MCGRFKKSQLEELNNDFYEWDNQTVRSFQSKFLYACLIVFGMSLFNSCSVSEQHLLGSIAWFNSDNDQSLTSFSPAANRVEKDSTKKINQREMLKGKVAYIPDEEIENPICSDTTQLIEEIDFVKGDVADIEPIMTLGQIVAEPDTIPQEILPDTLWDDSMVDGGLMWSESFTEYIEETSSLEIEEPIKHTETIDSTINNQLSEILKIETDIKSVEINPNFSAQIEIFEAILFPSPTRDNTTVVINVAEEMLFDIYLYAINGKQVKSIYNGMLANGRQEFILDLTPYMAGSYLIVIVANGQKETLRIEKLN